MKPIQGVCAVILSGGLARRLNGKEKGLQQLNGKFLVAHIVERLTSQVSTIWLNINRHHDQYQQHFPQLPYYSDTLPDFQGPLSGMLSGLQHIPNEYLLFVPCDSPFLPMNLVKKLFTALQINHATIAYAHDGERAHPTFALLHRSVLSALEAYLHAGERRVLQFFQSQSGIAVDFSEQPTAFRNFNTPEEFASGQFSPQFCKIPLLAITGYSGTGKTTLLEKLIPLLKQRGIQTGLIKHSHHNVDIDKPGKDSHRLRLAGATPTVVACDERWAFMVETAQPTEFSTILALFEGFAVDVILVEGFKHEALPKIQLHRQHLAKPLPEEDSFTLATATDYPLARQNCLDINRPEQIADFIISYLQRAK